MAGRALDDRLSLAEHAMLIELLCKVAGAEAGWVSDTSTGSCLWAASISAGWAAVATDPQLSFGSKARVSAMQRFLPFSDKPVSPRSRTHSGR